MDEQTNKFLIPGAIVLAAVVIAVAVIYSVNGPSVGDKKGNSGTAAIGALPEVSSTDFVLGDKNAPVTIIEYGDFQCPFCGKFFKETEPTLREKYIKTGKVKFIYRDFAFLGPESTLAANAAKCAGEQGKFWEYHDYLYSNQVGENQGTFSKDNLKGFAKVVGLDKEKFNSCLDLEKYNDAVSKETKAGGEAGVTGTPANFINGVLYAGALPTNNFTQIIDAELTKLGK
ncbi:MAG: DsbA family protein [Candidatus Azambacteria bacterium]|nr:DsbA family protein [Candidatus Azambacteria bacterium]